MHQEGKLDKDDIFKVHLPKIDDLVEYKSKIRRPQGHRRMEKIGNDSGCGISCTRDTNR